MSAKQGQFWRSVPGMVTAVAGLLAAAAGLITALTGAGLFSPAARPADVSGARSAEVGAPLPADVNGRWEANVTYSWGATYKERFAFQVDGDRLTGTGTYLGVPRPLREGVVNSEHIRFVIPLEDIIGSERRAYELRYTGVAVNGGLHFQVTDSRGNVDIQFAAARQLLP
jgi:hypothetical protein